MTNIRLKDSQEIKFSLKKCSISKTINFVCFRFSSFENILENFRKNKFTPKTYNFNPFFNKNIKLFCTQLSI